MIYPLTLYATNQLPADSTQTLGKDDTQHASLFQRRKTSLINTNHTALPNTGTNMATCILSERKLSSHMASVVGSTGKKRTRAPSFMPLPSPNDDLVDAYDNDVARAIRQNDGTALRDLLYEEDRCFHGVNRNGETLLHLACRRGNLDAVEFLVLDAAVSTDAVDSMGRTILHDVLWRPRYQEAMEILDFLLCVVSPALLVAEDIRGHSCFDYSRKDDYEVWMAFIQKYSNLIQRRAKLAGLNRRSPIDNTM